MNTLKKIALAAGIYLLCAVGGSIAYADSVAGPLVSSTESAASPIASVPAAESPDPSANADESEFASKSDRPGRDGKSTARSRKPREPRAVESLGTPTGDTLADLIGNNLPSQGF